MSKNNDKARRIKLHAQQMRKLELSAEPRLSLGQRRQLLEQLKPKYLIKAIDETVALKLEFDRTILLTARDKLSSGEWTTANAMETFTKNDTP